MNYHISQIMADTAVLDDMAKRLKGRHAFVTCCFWPAYVMLTDHAGTTVTGDNYPQALSEFHSLLARASVAEEKLAATLGIEAAA